MNAICCTTGKNYSCNLFHFLAQQFHAIYRYWKSSNEKILLLHYIGPFKEFLEHIPFIKLTDLHTDNQTKIIEPICNSNSNMLCEYSTYLKSIFVPKIKIDSNKKFTIVQRLRNRKIANIDNLLDNLSRFNKVDIVHLETLTFLEQVEHIYNSQLVLGAHGAGLTHLLFADKLTTTFIEIYPQHFTWQIYKDLANKLQIPFYYLESQLDLTFFHKEGDMQFLRSHMNESLTFNRHVLFGQEVQRLRGMVRDVEWVDVDNSQITTILNNNLWG